MTMRKKTIDARQLIKCLKDHHKLIKIYVKLDISSFHPLRFEMKTEVKELQQPRELDSAEGKEEQTGECLTTSTPYLPYLQRNTKDIQTSADQSECEQGKEDLKEDRD